MEGKTFTISAKRFDEERFRLFFQCSYSQKVYMQKLLLEKSNWSWMLLEVFWPQSVSIIKKIGLWGY